MRRPDSRCSVDLLVLDFAGVCTPTSSIESLHLADPTGRISTREEITSLVAEARPQGVLIAILSNEISTDWDVELFDQVDHVVNCADNQIFKPDRRAFQRCTLLTGVSPERSLVVDDHPDNITVAASLGMKTVLFDPADVEASTQLIREAMA